MRYLTYYSLQHQFDFGKYKGKSVEEVFSQDRNYIYWCIRKIDWFLLADDVIKRIFPEKAGESNVNLPLTLEVIMGATEGELRSRIDEKIKDYEKKMEVIYEREQSKEMMELHREKDREDKELTRDAFSDGDGTELWQFYED